MPRKKRAFVTPAPSPAPTTGDAELLPPAPTTTLPSSTPPAPVVYNPVHRLPASTHRELERGRRRLIELRTRV